MKYWLDIYRNGWRLARLEAEGPLGAAIPVAMQAIQEHQATSARLVDQDSNRVAWRGYPDTGPR